VRFDFGQAGISAGAGIIAALVNLSIILALAALIFAGPLTGYVNQGIGVMVVGVGVLGILFALLSSRPGVIMFGQEPPALVVVLVSAQVGTTFTLEQGEVAYTTILALLVSITFACGVAFLLLGVFRLGGLVRYLPYPVVGGFLAGTGWLLVVSGVGLMVGATPTVALLPQLFAVDNLVTWLPGVGFGLILLIAMQRSSHPLVLPGLLCMGVLAWYGGLWVSGWNVAMAEAAALLIGPFTAPIIWQPLTPADFGLIDWGFLLAHVGSIGTAVAIATTGLLLNVSGLQLVRREEIDLNRELCAAGLTQLMAGWLSAPPGYHSLSSSTLAYRMGARSRLTSMMMGLSLLVVFWFGTDVIGLLPRMVLGGVICYLGLAFLYRWLVTTWRQLPWADYGLICVIMVLIAWLGLVTGVGLGIGIAVVLFVIAYSRIEVVKHELTGATVQSRVTRSYAEQERLRDLGDQLAIYYLQGFIFFGTAHALFERVRLRVQRADLAPLRFVIFDFRLVSRLDSTALLSFTKLHQLAEHHGFTLLFCQMNTMIERQVRQGLAAAIATDYVRVMADVDRGIEWCETILLAPERDHVRLPTTLMVQFAHLGPQAAQLVRLVGLMERQFVAAGTVLIRRGDPADALFVIESGQVTAQVVQANGVITRLETMHGGRVVGELGFYLRQPRTADVVVGVDSWVYRVGWADLERLGRDDPALLSGFHQLMAHLLSERAVHLIRTVDALQRG
jgi:SulP family sulfate permease